MMRRRVSFSMIGLVLLSNLGMAEEAVRNVRVLNLPEVQTIRGKVAIEGLPPHSSFFSREGKVVPPVGRTEVEHLVELGILEASGFEKVTLSLHAESQGRVTQTGPVGVLLVPDRDPIRRSMRLEGQILLASELESDLPIGSSPVAGQASFEVAFPRYRVLLYNETNATASVDVYAYLTR